MKLSASEQVQQWLIALPPRTKHQVRLALRKLALSRGDIRALHPPLDGFCRLRIGSKRIIYRQISRDEIRLEYANSRDRIYEVFQEILRARTVGR